MKHLLIISLLCAILLSGCVTNTPEDHFPDGGSMEHPEPDSVSEDRKSESVPASEKAETGPADEEIKAMRPRLILDGCEPGTTNGRTVRITGYEEGTLTAELSNASGEEWDYTGTFTLSMKDGEQWKSIPWPEGWAWPECLYELEDGQSMTYVFELTELGLLDSGEYLLQTDFSNTGCIETTFRLVFTE